MQTTATRNLGLHCPGWTRSPTCRRPSRA